MRKRVGDVGDTELGRARARPRTSMGWENVDKWAMWSLAVGLLEVDHVDGFELTQIQTISNYLNTKLFIETRVNIYLRKLFSCPCATF